MTIAAGFVCKDGMLLCADREESSGASKKGVQRLFVIHDLKWSMIIATAGSGPAGDLAVKRLRFAFLQGFCDGASNVNTLESKHEQIIIDVLTKIHEDHVWKNPRTDHAFKLVIGINFLESQGQYLYLTEDNIPQPIRGYCCVGAGEDLCTFFCESLYNTQLNKEEVILLAAFIFREVNSTVQFCGKGVDMVLLEPGVWGAHITPSGVESIQSRIPGFADAMKGFWETTAKLPGWAKSIDNAEERLTESSLGGAVFSKSEEKLLEAMGLGTRRRSRKKFKIQADPTK